METNEFAALEPEFTQRVETMIWCNVATIDSQSRPRSRIMHPVWEGATGWVTSRRSAHKASHLAGNPYMSLAYIANVARPVYVECAAEWVDDAEEKLRVWNFIRSKPEPYGFDPASIFNTVDNPNYGLLHLTPWRIELVNLPGAPLIWRRR